jgi:hypothetical protein
MGRLAPAVMLILSLPHIATAGQISLHALYLPITLATLFSLAELVQAPSRKRTFVSIALVALAFTVVEYALFLLLTFAICLAFRRKTLFNGWSKKDILVWALVCLLLFTGILLVVWPGAILKLTLLRNYLCYAYFTIARSGEWSTVPFWDSWRNRIPWAPIQYGLILFALCSLFRKSFRKDIYLPFLIYAGLIFLTTVRNKSPYPTYISSLLSPLYALTGLVIADHLTSSARLRRAQVVLLLAAVVGATFHLWFFARRAAAENCQTPLKQMVQYVRAKNLHQRTLLIQRSLLPTFKYYFPEAAPCFSFSNRKDSSATIASWARQPGVEDILLVPDDTSPELKSELEKTFDLDVRRISGGRHAVWHVRRRQREAFNGQLSH